MDYYLIVLDRISHLPFYQKVKETLQQSMYANILE